MNTAADDGAVVVTALDRQAGGPDDNAAQGGHLVPVAFHLTQDPISGPESPAMGKGNKHVTASIGAHTSQGVRRLTPTECERLMGWPDGWTVPGPDSRRYAACGDGVVANVAEWIGRRLLAEMRNVLDREVAA